MRNSKLVQSEAFNQGLSLRDVLESLSIAVGLVFSVVVLSGHLSFALAGI
jgi:hypothetical protein